MNQQDDENESNVEANPVFERWLIGFLVVVILATLIYLAIPEIQNLWFEWQLNNTPTRETYSALYRLRTETGVFEYKVLNAPLPNSATCPRQWVIDDQVYEQVWCNKP